MLSVLKWLGIIVVVLIVGLLLIGWIFSKITAPPKFQVDLKAPSAKQNLEQYFADLNNEQRIKFNGIVLVRKGSETLLKRTYGEDGFGRSMDPNSSLRLGSVSKQFTAIGILTLVEKERVGLDDKVSKFLPDCQYDVTVRSLLNHTSGIPVNYMGMPKSLEVTNTSVEEWVCAKDGTLKKSGAFKYSNTGYILLARIIERVSGDSFEDYMKSSVFEPLGLTQTRVWNRLSEDEFPNRAAGFRANAKTPKPMELTHLDGVAGDGGVFSSLNDLENWAEFWTDDRLISKALKAQAMTGGQQDYGFGIIRQGDAIWHNGRWLAADAFFYLNIKNGDLVILVDNGANYTADKIGQQIARGI